MSNPVTLSSIGQIFVTVRDLKRAIAFYRDTLGMNFLFEAPPSMAFFDCGGIRLMLGIPEKPEYDHPTSLIYFNVDDLRANYETLRDQDVRFDSAPTVVHKTETMELWMAFLRDSEDNPLAMMSEVQLG